MFHLEVEGHPEVDGRIQVDIRSSDSHIRQNSRKLVADSEALAVEEDDHATSPCHHQEVVDDGEEIHGLDQVAVEESHGREAQDFLLTSGVEADGSHHVHGDVRDRGHADLLVRDHSADHDDGHPSETTN